MQNSATFSETESVQGKIPYFWQKSLPEAFEGLAGAEFQVLFDGRREKMIAFEFGGLGHNYHF